MDPATALDRKIARLPGPLLVIGAGGFIGANLLRLLAARRDDVCGTTHNHGSWRLAGIPASKLLFANLLDHDSMAAAVARTGEIDPAQARAWIVEHHSQARMVDGYEQAARDVARGERW